VAVLALAQAQGPALELERVLVAVKVPVL